MCKDLHNFKWIHGILELEKLRFQSHLIYPLSVQKDTEGLVS